MESEVLDLMNTAIKREHGIPVSKYDTWADTELDSFGSIMVILELHDKYGKLPKDWMNGVNFNILTIQDILTKVCSDEDTIL